MQLLEFDNRSDAAQAAGRRIASALHRRLEHNERASLIVSGGSSPAPVYAYLSHKELAWHRVDVLLSDERWVPPEHPDSNEKMLRESLAVSRARYAKIVSYFDPACSLESRCASLNKEIEELPQPFAGALLGMGTDGHFASLFPDADNVQDGLDLEGGASFLPVHTPSSPYPRLSMTLAALLRSDEILLLIFGAEKRARLEEAIATDSDLPVAHLLRQECVPVFTFWAP